VKVSRAASDEAVSLSRLLNNLSVALQHTRDLGLELEEHMLDICSGEGRVAKSTEHSLQKMDLLVQKLADLGRFSNGLADLVSQEVEVNPKDALGSMHLRDMAFILESGETATTIRSEGVVDLF